MTERDGRIETTRDWLLDRALQVAEETEPELFAIVVLGRVLERRRVTLRL